MTELMTMRDIAGLARVQRPVVTMWRRRSRASAHPFPAPHHQQGGQEYFRREDVVTWLEDTRRGNNDQARADAATHSLLRGSSKEAEVMSALITLRHVIGEPLAALHHDDLLDLADEHDPDDKYLRREIERCMDLSRMTADCDQFVDASWGVADAHRRLVESRLSAPGSGRARAALAEPARRFLLGLIGPIAAELGQPDLMDPTGAAIDLLAECASAAELPVRLMDGDSAAHRLTRRQLLLAEVPHALVARGGGDWAMLNPTAHLVVLPSAADPAMDALAQLELLDEVAGQVTANQAVLCLAPAATLVDPLSGAALGHRDQLLREGRVRAIVRLPAGLRPAQAREHSALWLLGEADSGAVGERRTLVADLSARSLRDCEGLPDDLVAAWQGREGARRRAWAHLYPVLTAALVSDSGTLVPPRPVRPAATTRAGADWAVSLRAADEHRILADYQLTVTDEPAVEVTVEQAKQRGWVRLLPGRKVDLSGLPSGTVAVATDPSELAEPQRVDRLALRTRTDHELTEPGDIIFSLRPTPHAVVDVDGGTLVLAPARVLRVRDSAPLVPAAVAARINAATSANWRAWTLAVVAEPTREVLGEALTGLAREQARLAAELAAVGALAADLTTAVESRRLSITKITNTKISNTKENHGPSSH